jgi:hypothetical protein
MGEAKWKQARDASDAENAIPPVQAAARIMRAMLEICTDVFPGYAMTMFVFEPKELADREDRMPRFNYASTAPRADMIAVLKRLSRGRRGKGRSSTTSITSCWPEL